MISNYFNILHQSFNTIWWVHLIVLFLFFLATLVLIFITLLCILDATYRPHISQYPFNFFLDRICPIFLIISPSLLIYWLNPVILSLREKFFCIILLHIFILVPLLYLWSKHRNWHKTKYHDTFFLDSPLLFFHIALGVTYPLFWFFFLSFNRYSNLNTTLDIFKYFNLDLFNDFIPFIIVLSFYLPWYKNFIQFFFTCRAILWQSFSNLCQTCYYVLLKYNIFFQIFKSFHKFSFIFGNFLIISHDIYSTNYKYSSYRYLLKYLYFNSKNIFYIILLFFIFEIIIFKGKIYYSLFLIFNYTLIYFLIYFLLLMYRKDFIDDVCLVDYWNKNWENPKYPSYFWHNFEDHTSKYYWSFTSEEQNLINSKKNTYEKKKYLYRPTLLTRVQHLGYCYRVKAAYRTLYGVRWVHGTAKPLHNLTPLFMQRFLERGYLISTSNGWRNFYPIIQYLEAKGFKTQQLPEDFYKNHLASLPKVQNFTTLMEHNVLTNFTPLQKQNIYIENFKGQLLDSQRQNNPDVVIKMNYQFNDKRNHGLDHKTDPSSKNIHGYILSNISEDAYTKGIRRFQSDLAYNCSQKGMLLNMVEINKYLELLVKTSNNLEQHQIIWANAVQYFPKEFIPPIKVPNNFCIADLNQKYLDKWQKIPLKAERISNYLQEKKIPEFLKEKPSLPPEALELFKDSFIQELMSEA